MEGSMNGDYNFTNVKNAINETKGGGGSHQRTSVLSIGPSASGFFDEEQKHRRYVMRITVTKPIMGFLKMKAGDYIEFQYDKDSGKGLIRKAEQPKDGFKLSGNPKATSKTALFRYPAVKGITPCLAEVTECTNVDYTHMGVVFDLPKSARFDMGPEELAQWVVTGVPALKNVKRKMKER